MPIYEYQCCYCNKKFEYLVFGSTEPQQCQYCGEGGVRRIMSTCSFFNSSSYERDTRGYSKRGGSASCNGCSSSNCSGCK